MNARVRPEIDPVASWRVAELARLEGRSLANAANRLIEAGWNSKMAKAEFEIMPHRLDLDMASSEKSTMAHHLPTALIDEIRATAVRERRSASAVAAALLHGALIKARAANTAPATA